HACTGHSQFEARHRASAWRPQALPNGANSLYNGRSLLNPGQVRIPGRDDIVPYLHPERRGADGSLVTPAMRFRVAVSKRQHTAAVMVGGREMKKLLVGSARHQHDEGRSAQI